MNVTLDGRVVIVTGAAQGIGRAIAIRAADAGAAGLLMTDRESGEEVMGELSVRSVPRAFVRADLAKAASAHAIVETCLARFGRVDGLVNAAGATTRASVLSADAELFDHLFAVNAKAPMLLMQACIRTMKAQGTGGSIVNLLTMNIHGGSPSVALYAATKAALGLLTKNAAHAHRFDRIRVLGVNVGWTDTPGERTTQAALGRDEAWLEGRSAQQPFGRLLDPDDVARLVLFLLSDCSAPMTGAVIDQEQWVLGARD
jgi:NAD(P)-dependent dehydrogenase (short-subunit alcohol dehydrogenase family)